MASSFAIQSPADAVNGALVRIGYKLRVGSLTDGSAAAKKALDIYAQTRDELLRQNDWAFAERNVVLTLLKTAPALTNGGYGYIPPVVWNPATNPPLPWIFEYGFPGDCLKVRAVKSTPLFIPNFNPIPTLFAVVNDSSYTPPQRVIVCDVGSAQLVYTGQITDPTTWDADFCEAIIDQLAQRLAPGLNPDILKLIVPEAAQSQAIAEAEQG
jgi:hypothetical protein